jgi:hypothetical protein
MASCFVPGSLFDPGHFDVIDASSWLVSVNGILHVTRDAGISWQSMSPNWSTLDPIASSSGRASYDLNDLSYVNASEGWGILTSSHCTGLRPAVCETATEVVHSSDGGADWQVVAS